MKKWLHADVTPKMFQTNQDEPFRLLRPVYKQAMLLLKSVRLDL